MRESTGCRRRPKAPRSGATILAVVAAAAVLAAPVAAAQEEVAGPDAVAAARARFAASLGSLEPADLRPPMPPAEENAATAFMAAAGRLELTTDDLDRLRHLVRQDADGWNAADGEWLTAVAGRNREALALFTGGADRGACAFPPIAIGAPGAVSELLVLSRALPLLAALGRAELRRPDAAAPSLVSLAAVSEGLLAQPEMVYVLFGVAAEHYHLAVLHHAAESPALPARRLEELEARLPQVAAADIFAHAMAFIAVEAAAHVAGGPGGSESPEGDAAATAMLDELRAMAEAARDPARFADFMRSAAAQPDTPARVVTALLMPNVAETLAKLQAVEAARALARAAVAARVEAGRSGAYPAEIELPTSPFSDSRPTWSVQPDGSAELADPAAAEAWQQRWGNTKLPPLPFRWHLPPPIGEEGDEG